jgi:hypothetical protein
MEINRRTKADLIKKAEQAYLKLKENRRRNQRKIQRTDNECPKGESI